MGEQVLGTGANPASSKGKQKYVLPLVAARAISEVSQVTKNFSFLSAKFLGGTTCLSFSQFLGGIV